MAVYTFSTQDKKKPQDKDTVNEVKAYCDKHKLNFSLVVIEQLRKFLDGVDDGR